MPTLVFVFVMGAYRLLIFGSQILVLIYLVYSDSWHEYLFFIVSFFANWLILSSSSKSSWIQRLVSIKFSFIVVFVLGLRYFLLNNGYVSFKFINYSYISNTSFAFLLITVLLFTVLTFYCVKYLLNIERNLLAPKSGVLLVVLFVVYILYFLSNAGSKHLEEGNVLASIIAKLFNKDVLFVGALSLFLLERTKISVIILGLILAYMVLIGSKALIYYLSTIGFILISLYPMNKINLKWIVYSLGGVLLSISTLVYLLSSRADVGIYNIYSNRDFIFEYSLGLTKRFNVVDGLYATMHSDIIFRSPVDIYKTIVNSTLPTKIYDVLSSGQYIGQNFAVNSVGFETNEYGGSLGLPGAIAAYGVGGVIFIIPIVVINILVLYKGGLIQRLLMLEFITLYFVEGNLDSVTSRLLVGLMVIPLLLKQRI